MWVARYEVAGRRKYLYGKTRKAVCPINSGRACLGGGRSRFTGACCLWALIWIDRPLIMVRDTVKERTWRRHEEVVRLHVKPSIGSKYDAY